MHQNIGTIHQIFSSSAKNVKKPLNPKNPKGWVKKNLDFSDPVPWGRQACSPLTKISSLFPPFLQHSITLSVSLQKAVFLSPHERYQKTPSLCNQHLLLGVVVHVKAKRFCTISVLYLHFAKKTKEYGT